MSHILLARGHFLLIFVNDLIRRWLSGTLAKTPLYQHSSKEWNSTESLVLGSYLVTRIWVHSMIGLLKMPLSTCQWRWKEIWNVFLVIHWVHWGGTQNKDISAVSQSLLTEVKLCLRHRLPSFKFCNNLCVVKEATRKKNISLKKYITKSEWKHNCVKAYRLCVIL